VPHIKVKPFETSKLDRLIAEHPSYRFRAIEEKGRYEMLGVAFEGEEFLLEIKPKGEMIQIKPDAITRPLDVNKIKRVLAELATLLSVEVVHSNIAISAGKPALANRYNKKIEDFENPRFSRDEIAIEVGFGSGRHLLYQAAQHPERLFIGIEIHTPSAEQVLKQIALQGLENVWVVDYDARLLLEMMPSNSCCDIYVHFPVPWDKKPHRRVINPRFLSEALRVLEPGGKLELRTDSDNYYHHALEIFSQPKQIDFRVEKNRDISVVSKYEDRWRAQQKDIYTLTVTAAEDSAPRERNYHFGFGEGGEPDFSQLPAKAIVREDYFVHFERRYHIVGTSDQMLRCSFGSFDMPEHKYLLQQGSQLRYYPQNPVPTETNYLAHQQIGALLYG